MIMRQHFLDFEQTGAAFRDQDLWYQTNFLGVSGGID